MKRARRSSGKHTYVQLRRALSHARTRLPLIKRRCPPTPPPPPPTRPTASTRDEAQHARAQQQAHTQTALHRSAEHRAADFTDERTVLRIDDSDEMRALLIAAGLAEAPSGRSVTISTVARPVAWPHGQDLGSSWKARAARERYLNVQPLDALWPAQQEGIAFMRRAEQTRPRGYAGGIIADEMGLGKTLQFLTYVLYEQQEHCRATGTPYGCPTLVVVDKGLVDTWRAEITKHFPPDAFAVAYLCGGPSATRDVTPARIMACFRIVITTYPMLVTAAKRRAPGNDQHPYAAALFETLWQRVLADEAHVASNRLSMRFKALCALKARFRWAQTGTPVLNDVNSVCALLHFVGGHEAAADVPLDMTARVERVSGTAIAARAASDTEHTEISVKNLLHVRGVLADVMLRRRQPVERHVQTTRLVDFETPGERDLYAHYYAKFRADSNAFAFLRGTGAAPGEEIHTTGDDYGGDNGDDDVAARVPADDDLEEGEIRDPAPSARALHMVSVDILHLRQICAAPVVVVHLDVPPRLLLDAGYRSEQRAAANTQTRILAHASRPTLAYLAAARLLLAEDPLVAAHISVTNAEAATIVDADFANIARRAAGTPLWEKRYTSEACARLRAVLRHVRARIVPSIGTKARMFIRHYLHEVPSDDKFIIFSDWVRVLTHLHGVFEAAGVRALLLTGDHTPAERTATLRTLECDPSVRALLGSLQVVATGLNIDCANHVTAVAQWWNPQTTKQGQYRVRRPGQTKSCYDYNVIIRGTVEEDVRRMAAEKEHIARILLETDEETLAIVDALAEKRAPAPALAGATQRDMLRMLINCAAASTATQ